MRFPDQFRWHNVPGGYATKDGDPFGVFLVPAREANGRILRIIACDGTETGWEHISVSLFESNRGQVPSWAEMCIAKDLFWDDEEVVVQFHPKKSDYVNIHPGVLHMWKYTGGVMPTPKRVLV